MALDFPASPSVNDTYTSGGRTWRWNGTAWVGATPYSGQATITGGTINNTPIGGTTRAAGAFTTVDANSNILSSGGVVGYSSGTTVYTIGSGGYNGPVGGSTPAAGVFTTLAASPTGNSIQFQGSDGIIYRSGGTGTNAGFHRFRYFDTDVAVVSSTGLAVTGIVSASVADKITLSGVAATDQYFLAQNYTNADGTESVTTAARASWRFRMRNATSVEASIDYRAAAAAASAWSSIATFSSTGLAVTGTVSVSGGDLYVPNGVVGRWVQQGNNGFKVNIDGTDVAEFGAYVATQMYKGLAVTGNLSATDELRITNTGGIKYILMGNQDAGGTNKPSVIKAANGNLEFGYGNSWSSAGGGTTTVLLALGAQISAQPVYNQTTGSAANVFVDSNGDLKRSTSSIKYKTDVCDYTRGIDALMSLRPVFYKGKSEADGDKQFAGLIAEEVHEAGLTEFVQYDKDGKPDALAYQNMVALLISSSKELVAELKSLRARVAQLENK